MNFKNTFAIVTGASTGIGKEIALALASNGATVGLVARSKRKLAQVQTAIREKGGTSVPLPTDLRSKDAIRQLSDFVAEEWKRLDILVHAAGVWHNEGQVYAGVPLIDTPAQQIDEVLEVGITAPMQLTRSLLPFMVKNHGGKILGISGTFASGGAGWLHYYVSKLALEHFVVGLSQEMRKHKIQVNCVSPSDVSTEALQRFFPDDAKTALQPSDVAALCLFLLSEQADHITGQIIVIKNRDA